MTLLIHIAIALASVGYTTYIFTNPSRKKLRISYSLIAATIASGTLLVIAEPAHMVQACTTGLLYVATVSLALVFVHHKLVAQETAEKREK